MKKRRAWSAEEKARIVLSGLKGRGIAEICTENGISQGQYYQWRDQFLGNAGAAFAAQKPDREKEKLARQNERLKALVGELTLELKKSDWELCE